jgi:hypothetical protein
MLRFVTYGSFQEKQKCYISNAKKVYRHYYVIHLGEIPYNYKNENV